MIRRISVITTLLLVVFTVLLCQTVEPGYAVSIYHQVPYWAFAVGLLSVTGSVGGAVWLLSRQRYDEAAWTTFSACYVVGVLVMLAPLLGYRTRYGDPITHVGYIRDIVATGQFPDTIYPGSHLFATALHFTTGLPTEVSWSLISLIVFGMWLLICAITARQLSIPVAATIPFTFLTMGVVSYPAKFTYAIFYPFVVYLGLRFWYFDSERRHTRLFVVLAVLLSASVLSHPVPTIVALGFVGLTWLLSFSNPVSRWLSNRGLGFPSATGAISPPLVLCFSGLVIFLWWTYTWLFNRVVSLFVVIFGLRQGRDQFMSGSSVTSAFSSFGFDLGAIAELGIIRFGDLGIALGSAVVALLLIAAWHNRGDLSMPDLPIVFPLIVLGAGVWSVIEFTIGFVPSVSFTRALRVGVHVAPVVGGFVVFALVQDIQTRSAPLKKVMSVTVVAILVSGVVLAGAGSYRGPIMTDKNSYITDSDVAGMNWYFENKDRSIETTTLWRSNDRYMDYLLRPEERTDRNDELQYEMETNDYRPPDSFGYGGNETFAQTLNTTCSYYLEGELGRQTYLNVWEPLYNYTPEGFNRLHRADPSYAQVYDNGNMQVGQVGCATS